MVTGSLLGLNVGNGVLEVTHAFPLPEHPQRESKSDGGEDGAGTEGHDFQLEMMRMLREVNVDNNCVGWYQSMYLGIFSTSSLLETQLSYQTDLSPNAVVILYDPMQTTHGNLVVKCYRLTEECVRIKTTGSNKFIDPKNIFEQVPIKLTNPGLVQALLTDVADGVHKDGTKPAIDEDGLFVAGADTTFDRLDLSTNPYLEKHVEFLCGWVDDLASEQQKFQYYSRQLARTANRGSKDKRSSVADEQAKSSWESGDAPRRMESLLISNQIRSYCDQVSKFTSGSIGKLYLMEGLHKHDDEQPSSPST